MMGATNRTFHVRTCSSSAIACQAFAPLAIDSTVLTRAEHLRYRSFLRLGWNFDSLVALPLNMTLKGPVVALLRRLRIPQWARIGAFFVAAVIIVPGMEEYLRHLLLSHGAPALLVGVFMVALHLPVNRSDARERATEILNDQDPVVKPSTFWKTLLTFVAIQAFSTALIHTVLWLTHGNWVFGTYLHDLINFLMFFILLKPDDPEKVMNGPYLAALRPPLRGRNTDSEEPLNLEKQKDAALEMLKRFGQEHVPAGFDSLNLTEKGALLRQIADMNWTQLSEIYHELIKGNRRTVLIPTEYKEAPAKRVDEIDDSSIKRGRSILTEHPGGGARFGIIVPAGGRGSGLGYDHPKGLFPATPVFGTTLYQVFVEKSLAAARAHGHSKMYPLIFMLSKETENETKDYFEKNNYFGQKDRIRFVMQPEIAAFDKEGHVVMKSSGEIYEGGAGHADAFEYVLREPDTVRWLKKLGVEYMQYSNIDNTLSPIAHEGFLGEHAKSFDKSITDRAHISLALVPKDRSKRLGNTLLIPNPKDGGRTTVQHSLDYGNDDKIDAHTLNGDPSIRLITVSTANNALPAPFTIARNKKVRLGDQEILVDAPERSSGNIDRYGALVLFQTDEVFASIKKKDSDDYYETPASAKTLQSTHWKEKLRAAGEAVEHQYIIPESTVLELPWDADYLTPLDLEKSLQLIHFPRELAQDAIYGILPRFGDYLSSPLLSQGPPNKGGDTEGLLPLAVHDRIRDEIAKVLSKGFLQSQLAARWDIDPDSFEKYYQSAGNIKVGELVTLLPYAQRNNIAFEQIQKQLLAAARNRVLQAIYKAHNDPYQAKDILQQPSAAKLVQFIETPRMGDLLSVLFSNALLKKPYVSPEVSNKRKQDTAPRLGATRRKKKIRVAKGAKKDQVSDKRKQDTAPRLVSKSQWVDLFSAAFSSYSKAFNGLGVAKDAKEDQAIRGAVMAGLFAYVFPMAIVYNVLSGEAPKPFLDTVIKESSQLSPLEIVPFLRRLAGEFYRDILDVREHIALFKRDIPRNRSNADQVRLNAIQAMSSEVLQAVGTLFELVSEVNTDRKNQKAANLRKAA